MPPRRKIIECEECSRSKLRTQIVYPQIHCKGRPDLFILGTSPSFNDDKTGKHFSNESGVVYLRSVLKEISDNYVIDTAVRCFSEGQPTPKAIKVCKPNWMKLVKEYNPKVVVALGKYAAEAVLGKKITLKKVVGQSLGVEYDGHIIPTVFNYAPAYVAGFDDKKGGEAEKTKNLWFDTWDTIQSVLEDGLSEKPEVMKLKRYNHVIKFLNFLLNDYDGVIAYDYETWGDKNTLRPELCSKYKVLSVGVGYNDKGVSFPLDYPDFFSSSEINKISKKWTEVLKKKCIKVAQNAKFEHKCNIKRFGYTDYLEDTMLIMNVINELAPCSLGSVGRYFGYSWAGYKIEMSGVQQNPINTPIDELLGYNALDGLLTYKIYGKGQNRLSDKGKKILAMKQNYSLHLAEVETNGLFTNIGEIPVVREELVLAKDEAESNLLDRPEIKKVERWCVAFKKEDGAYVLDKKGKKVQNIKSFKEGKDSFNPKSPIQMKYLCLNVLKLPIEPVIKWEKGKKKISYSFDKKVLEPLEDAYPIIRHLNAVRSINSMFSGFLDKWENFTGPDDCCHTNYNQDVVLTGRLSSTEPNLQNIPEKSPIKRVFSSRWGDDGLILSADYKQIEPRILAGWSGDPALCEALNGGFDLHQFVASKIFGVKYDDVTYDQRQLGKRMNLGQMYGQTPEGLAKAAQITIEHARELQRIYYDRFPGIKDFRVKYHIAARRCGESIDLFGGIRHLPDAMSHDRRIKERAERQASNFPIQSTANHFCLIGLCEVMDLFKKREIPALVVGTVHDSLIIDFNKKYKRQVIKAVTEGMLIHNTSDYWGDKPVPMAIDISIGFNYKDLEDIVL